MSLTITTDAVYQAFYGDFNTHKAFVHSHTYAGNPLACRAALAVLYIMKRDDILKKAAEKSIYLHEKLDAALGSHHNVGEIRHIGLINAIELVEDKESKRPFNAEKRIGWHIFRKAMDLGLVLRPIGDILYFNPPLTIEKDTMDEAVRRCAEAVHAVLGDD